MAIIVAVLKLLTIPPILLLLPYFIVANNATDKLLDNYYLLILGVVYAVGEIVVIYRYFKRFFISRFADETTGAENAQP